MSSKNSNKLNIPEARQAMDKFKMEAANDLAVPTPYRIFLAEKNEILLKIVESTHHLNRIFREAKSHPFISK